MKSEDMVVVPAIAGMILTIAIWAGCVGTVMYVAYHFISKYW